MTKTATPKLSSTVLLVRDRGVLEVLMVARHYEIDFASGALVFPGGKANEEDASSDWTPLVDGEYDAAQQAARISAIRETYEESGVLLARPKDKRGEGAGLVGGDVAHRLAPFRESVDRREQSFLELIEKHDLVLATDALIYFGHWITPEMMPKRFDTHFYLVKAPSGQTASHDGRETTDAVWLNPLKALEMAEAEQATIIFPTRMNLRKLGQAKTCAEMERLFMGQAVVSVLPEVGKTGSGDPCLYIPAEAGYGQTIELLSNVKV